MRRNNIYFLDIQEESGDIKSVFYLRFRYNTHKSQEINFILERFKNG